MYNDLYISLYNVIFTMLTPFVIGIFDADLDKSYGLRYPGLYRQGKATSFLRLFLLSIGCVVLWAALAGIVPPSCNFRLFCCLGLSCFVCHPPNAPPRLSTTPRRPGQPPLQPAHHPVVGGECLLPVRRHLRLRHGGLLLSHRGPCQWHCL